MPDGYEYKVREIKSGTRYYYQEPPRCTCDSTPGLCFYCSKRVIAIRGEEEKEDEFFDEQYIYRRNKTEYERIDGEVRHTD